MVLFENITVIFTDNIEDLCILNSPKLHAELDIAFLNDDFDVMEIREGLRFIDKSVNPLVYLRISSSCKNKKRMCVLSLYPLEHL